MPNRMTNVFKRPRRKPEAVAVGATLAGAGHPQPPRPAEIHLDVELTVPRTRLEIFAFALVGEQGLGVGPVSLDRLTAAFGRAIERAGGSGSPSVTRSPAGVYTPEYWRFRIEAADAIAQDLLKRAGTSGRDA